MDSWWILSPSTAPWWFVGLLTGVLGVTGIISGAVITYRSLKASDERKQLWDRERIMTQYDREDDQRWDNNLRDVASQFVSELNQALTTSQEIAAKRTERVTMTFSALTHPDIQSHLSSAYIYLIELKILAPEPVISRAREVFVWAHTVAAEALDPEVFDNFRGEFGTREGDLIDAVRAALKVKQ